MNQPLLIILGPTAVGKTALAVHMADAFNGEVISADSRQVYKGMDIGTGKDLASYEINGKKISVHLVDIQVPGGGYHVHAFQEGFYRTFAEITSHSALPILCGGTGMYIHSILQEHELTAVPVDLALRAELSVCSQDALISRFKKFQSAHSADESSMKRLIRAIEIAEYLQKNTLVPVKRPLMNTLVIGLKIERPILLQRIQDRLNARFKEGMIEEVASLLEKGTPQSVLLNFGMEYKFITKYLKGELSELEMKELLYIAICQFAKRQMTFFRKMEKDGVIIHWIDGNSDQNVILKRAENLFHGHFKGLSG